jgi:hypothetical protein
MRSINIGVTSQEGIDITNRPSVGQNSQFVIRLTMSP